MTPKKDRNNSVLLSQFIVRIKKKNIYIFYIWLIYITIGLVFQKDVYYAKAFI